MVREPPGRLHCRSVTATWKTRPSPFGTFPQLPPSRGTNGAMMELFKEDDWRRSREVVQRAALSVILFPSVGGAFRRQDRPDRHRISAPGIIQRETHVGVVCQGQNHAANPGDSGLPAACPLAYTGAPAPQPPICARPLRAGGITAMGQMLCPKIEQDPEGKDHGIQVSAIDRAAPDESG